MSSVVQRLGKAIGTFKKMRCVKSIQIRSFFWSVFSCIRTEYGHLWSTDVICLQSTEYSEYRRDLQSTDVICVQEVQEKFIY